MSTSQTTDRQRLPVVLVSGFLGSGKTTLVNALLRDPRLADTAVAVNEFGKVPLDRHLIEQGADCIVVMADGCLCRDIAGNLEDAVMRICSRRESGDLPRFTRLIVEPSGLADLMPIAQAILRNPIMSRSLRLEAIIATVDAQFAEAQLGRHPESRKQVSLAERLVLTKTDLVDPATIARVKALLAQLNPLTVPISATQGVVDAAALLPASFLDPTSPAARQTPCRSALIANLDGCDPQHTDRTRALTLVAEAPLHREAFDAWLRGIRTRHGENLLRLKGFVNVTAATGPLVIQGVHHVSHPPVQRECWPDEDRRTRIVMITRGAADIAIETSWLAILPELVAQAYA